MFIFHPKSVENTLLCDRFQSTSGRSISTYCPSRELKTTEMARKKFILVIKILMKPFTVKKIYKYTNFFSSKTFFNSSFWILFIHLEYFYIKFYFRVLFGMRPWTYFTAAKKFRLIKGECLWNSRYEIWI